MRLKYISGNQRPFVAWPLFRERRVGSRRLYILIDDFMYSTGKNNVQQITKPPTKMDAPSVLGQLLLGHSAIPQIFDNATSLWRSQGHRTGSKSKQGQNVDSLIFSFSKWFPRYGTSMRNTEDFVVHARIWQKTVSAWARASACSDPEKKHNREELKFSKTPIWTIPTVLWLKCGHWGLGWWPPEWFHPNIFWV